MKFWKLNLVGIFFIFGVLFLLIPPCKVHATTISVIGKAKVLNTANSYLDFTNYNANVKIDNANGNFSGYAFLEDVGWVAFGTTDNSLGPVHINLITGAVTGKAKVLTTGAYLDFTGYNSDVTATIPGGIFSGAVLSEDMGWLDFTDTGVTSGTTSDTAAPSISLTALSPDPNNDSTPTISGTATEPVGTVSSVQFQMDTTSGTWTSCIADDGSFNSASEAFTCTVSTALSDGSHMMYVRATDSNTNTTATSSYASDVFTVDVTAPASFTLESPGDNSYISSERPTFRWKATTDAVAGLSKYVLEVDNPSLGSGQTSGDFTVDDIPPSRTTDYETNRYLIQYENFSDTDSTNNYISVHTKSSPDWGTDTNDGALRGGKISWKVKTIDNAGNETTNSRTVFVDRTNPVVRVTHINTTSFSSPALSTTDTTPAISGRITDPLAGGDTSLTQTAYGPRVASGPKSVEIKVEKKDDASYRLHTIYTINADTLYYACDDTKITDNAKQACDKYMPFTYTPQGLELGTYKITVSGKDNVDNASPDISFSLTITTLARITTPEEKKVIEEETKLLTPEEKEKVENEMEITKPTEVLLPGTMEKILSTIVQTIANMYWNILDGVKTLAAIWSRFVETIANTGSIVEKRIASAYQTYRNFNDESNQKTFYIVDALWRQATAFAKQISEQIAETYNTLAQKTPGIIGSGMKTAGNVITAIGNWITNVGTGIAQTGQSVDIAIKIISQNTATEVNNLTIHIGYVLSATRQTADNFLGPPTQKITTFLAITAEYWFDKEPTKILSVKVENVSPTSAVIYWQTNHHATSAVNYGFNTSYGKKIQSDEHVKEHHITITDLVPGKTYFFEVMSQNKNYVYDAYYTFQTPNSE